MWIWICVGIIVVSLVVHFFLGRRVWRAVRELGAEIRSLGTVSDTVSLELDRIGVRAAPDALTPRHGVNLETRA